MGKTNGKNDRPTLKNAKASSAKISKPLKLSKTKLKQRSKHSRAQIEKLNKDNDNIASIHSAIAASGPVSREASVLDVKSLREGLDRDERIKKQNERADKDLQSQLEMITGMAL